MPTYELVCIARLASGAVNSTVSFQDGIAQFVKPLAKTAALHVLDKGGVVRGFNLISTEPSLPYRMKRHQEIFSTGCVWSMHFDCNPSTMTALRKAFNFDERVIRHNIIKLGDSISDLTRHIQPDKL
ncbi:hypothetical protein BC829DRAFT_441213 [Chytridium lagenaria]|nr:hypothetical protein BC829DRAFT_441213 [Chytridium lagenaria]